MSAKALCFQAVPLFHSSVCSSDIVAMISHNDWNNFDKTDKEYSLALTVDPIRLWGSKVKVKFIVGHRG